MLVIMVLRGRNTITWRRATGVGVGALIGLATFDILSRMGANRGRKFKEAIPLR